MRLDEIRPQTRLDEVHRGTFVGAELTDESADQLEAWVAQQGFPKPQKAKDFHCTIAIDKKGHFAYSPEIYDPPVRIDPQSYEFKLFGPNQDILVLAFRNDELERQHRVLRKRFQFDWDFPNYVPHVTLAYDVDRVPDELPGFPLVFRREYVQPFDPPAMTTESNEMLYHGTTTIRIEQMQKEGIVRAPSYWGTEEIAEYYADEAVDADGGGEPRILALPLSRFDLAALQPDKPGLEEPLTHTLGKTEEKVWAEWERSSQSWQDSLAIIGSVRYLKPVPITQTLMETPLNEVTPRFRFTRTMMDQARGNKCQMIVQMPIMDFLKLTTSSRAEIEQIKQSAKSLLFYNRRAKMGDNREYERFVNKGRDYEAGDRDYQHGSIIPPFLVIQIDDEFSSHGRVRGHEGRHRAAALLKHGVQFIDVAICMRPGKNTLPDVHFGVEYHLKHEHLPFVVQGQFSDYITVRTDGRWKLVHDDMQKHVRRESAGENLHEGVSRILYHQTYIGHAAKILETDTIRLTPDLGTGSDQAHRRRDKFYYLSTTRSRIGAYHSPVVKEATGTVLLVLNGQKLMQTGFSGGPVDYWGPEFRKIQPSKNEMEDRIFSTKPEIEEAHRFIEAIHVYYPGHDDDTRGFKARVRILREIAIRAKKLGIPFFVYSDPKAFNLLDTRRAATSVAALGTAPEDYPLPDTDRKKGMHGQWRRGDFLKPWRELLLKPTGARLSREAQRYANLSLYHPRDAISSLGADFHNFKSGTGRPHLDKLLKVMKRLNLTSVREVVEYVAQKYKQD